MSALTKSVRVAGLLCQETSQSNAFQGYKYASSAISSDLSNNNEKQIGNDVQNKHETRISKHTENFSEGPDLSDFIAGVVPRYNIHPKPLIIIRL